MERAVILIGVKQTGALPQLQAVSSSVERMADWAKNHQQIPPERVKVITDDHGEVRAYQISDAVEEIVNLGVVEQLIVYFSGHGINKNGEYWLLSRAPGNPNEAVNVEGSLLLARHCGIGHTVLISDACRTAADGIQAQGVTGTNIFPNELGSGLEKPVDVFFACARGKPALEIQDPFEAASGYSALYTDVLAECLKGGHLDVLDYEIEGEKSAGLVRPRRLRDELRTLVSRRLREKLHRTPAINQTPDARIVSENAWLSRIPGLSRTDAPVTPVSRSTPVDPFTLSDALVSHAMAGDLDGWRHLLNVAGKLPEALPLKDAASFFTTAFGPSHFETQCGLKLRGARVARVVCKDASAEILDSDGSTIRMGALPKPGTLVLLELHNGTGVLVPVIPDFITELTFENNELTNLSYEPSDNSNRWDDYVSRLNELRALRSTIAAAVGVGVFRLEGEDASKLARRMQVAKGVDPSLALYAAYAYHDLQRRDLLKEMGSFLANDLGFAFFDVALLSGKLRGDLADDHSVVPHFPMLSQGWALLSAFGVEPPGVFGRLQKNLISSLWTMFDRDGVTQLNTAIMSGEIH